MKKREILTPDITPLIDVVFILLIFFIVSSEFKKERSALALNLPSSSAKELKKESKPIIIEVSKTELAIYGKEVSLKVLEEQVQKIKEKKRNIIFKIDKEVVYKKIVVILDMLQRNELFNISLVTNNKGKK